MEYVLLILCLVAVILLLVFPVKKHMLEKHKHKRRFDERGFDHNHIHRNGTKYDNYGYDYFGYDEEGYNPYGYNAFGKNAKGKYDRFYDTKSFSEEGFLNPKRFPVSLTTHARERMRDRLGICDDNQMDIQAIKAYRFGKSKRQIKKTSAYLVEEIEKRSNDGIVLIYKNFIYVFSTDNVLITVYKNDKISL